MAQQVTVTFTDNEVNRIDAMIAQEHNRLNGSSQVSSVSELARHATLVYLDFFERMSAGELDGISSAQLLRERVPGLDPFNGRLRNA